MKIPCCSICNSKLEMSGGHWKCPTCGFSYQVFRGQAGKPLWGLQSKAGRPMWPVGPKVERTPAPPQPEEKAFKEWLAEHGVTPEIYESADRETRWELETAFSQRHMENPKFALLPPQR